MAKFAELPDGTKLEFPDDTPDDVMDSTVKKHLGTQGQEQTSSLTDDLVERGKAAFGGIESAARMIPNMFPMAYNFGLDAVGKFVPENLQKDYHELASEAQLPMIEPFTEYGKVADEAMGTLIQKATRAPGAVGEAVIKGTGQTGAKELMDNPTALGPALTEIPLVAGMLVGGAKALPKQIKSLRESFTKTETKSASTIEDQIAKDLEAIKQKEQALPELLEEPARLDQLPKIPDETPLPVIDQTGLPVGKGTKDIKLKEQVIPEEQQPLSYDQFYDRIQPEAKPQGEAPRTPLLSIDEGPLTKTSVPDTQRLATRHDVPTLEFPLRQEVLNDLQPHTDAFRREIAKLEEQVSKQEQFVKDYAETQPTKEALKLEKDKLESLTKELNDLKDEFGAGLEQIGVKEASDAWGRSLYEGEAKSLPVEKTKTGFDFLKEGKRTGKGARKQGGAIDPEALGLTRIGEGLKGMKVYRAIAEKQGKVTPGQWVTPSKDIAVNVYAKGDASKVIEDYLPARDLYQVHPDGWVYAPKGTDLTNVKRTPETTFGQMAIAKGQRGSIGWKKDQISVEDYRKLFKERTGQDLPLEIAQESVRKLNETSGNAAMKTAKSTKLEKLTGIDLKGTLTPEEAKVAMESGKLKDIDTTMTKRILNIPMKIIASGTHGLRNYYNNPLLDAMLKPVGDAFSRAEAWGNQHIWSRNGVVKKWNALEKADYHAVWDALVKAEGNPDIPFEKIIEGMKPAQIEAAKALRKAHEQSLAAKNEFRERHGMKPISARANYLSGTFFGDNIFFALDKEGKIVAAIPGYASELAHARQWLSENYPELSLSEPVSNIRGQKRPGEARLTSDRAWDSGNLAGLLDKLIKDNPLQDKLVEVVKEYRDGLISDVKGVSLHEKFKSKQAVLGAQGFKPWEDVVKNAEDGFRAQINEIENSILRNELDKAYSKLDEFDSTLGPTNASKLAREKIDATLGYQNWLEGVERRMSQAATDLGYTGELGLKAYREGKGPIKAMMNVAAFSMDAAFFLMNILETPRNIINGVTHQMASESLGTKMKTAYGTIPMSWGIIKGTEASINAILYGTTKGKIGFRDANSKFYHDYFMKENVGNPTIESKRTVRASTNLREGTEIAKEFLDLTIKTPEYTGRYVAAQTLAHTFEAMGYERKVAAEMAVDSVKLFFGDYSMPERPIVYQRLGQIGEHGHQWRTWLHKEITNTTSAFVNKDPATLATMLGYQAIVFGLASVPAFNAMDQLFRLIREQATAQGGNSEMLAKISETMSPAEWIKANYGSEGDSSIFTPSFRGKADKMMEYLGVEGSTAGRTEWRVLPNDMWGILPAVDFGKRTAESMVIAGKELSKNPFNKDTDINAATKPFQQVLPKPLGRKLEIEYGVAKDDKNRVLDPAHEYTTKFQFKNEAEKRAYILGMQPKSRWKEGLDDDLQFKREREITEAKADSTKKLKEALNRVILRGDNPEAMQKAVNQFVFTHNNANIKAAVNEVLMEMGAPPSTIRKLQSLNNPSNMQMNKFIMEVVPELRTYKK